MIAEKGYGYLTAAACAACVALLTIDPAAAQSNPFGVARPEPNLAPQSGPFSGLFAWIAAQQSSLYQTLSGLVAAFRTEPSAGLALMAMSFGYGVFHAAGPGHGKAVITSYLVATGEGARRGIALSFAAAFVQAVTAIALVGVFTVALRATSVAMTEATFVIEIASYALVTLLGAWLVFVKAAALAPVRVHAVAGHHMHVHAEGSCCGHAHGPSPADLSGSWSAKRAAAAVMAVGIRPCTGAVLVLVFAFSQGVFMIGVASAFAMALGVGLTVAMLAALAVGARGIAARLAEGGSGWAMIGLRCLELGAAVIVLLFGLVLLGGTLSTG